MADRAVAVAFPVADQRSAAIPADAAQVPAVDKPFFFGAKRHYGKRANPVPHYAPGAQLSGDEDVDALAGYTRVPWPPVALAAARATAARQPPLGDHPQVLGQPDAGDPDVRFVFHGERVQPWAVGDLADRCPFASPASRQLHIETGHPQFQGRKSAS